MTLTTTTHLNFRGTARAALTFYQSVFGGQLTVVTYADFGMPSDAPGAGNVVFGSVESAEGFRVMAYDTLGNPGRPEEAAGSTTRENGVTITTQSFFVSVRGETVDDVHGYWEKLADGARIVEPFASSPWSPGFGMLTDRFGVTWIVDVASGNRAD
ncbi:MAG: VOC family protein [Thermomicrobiales bacterium]